ncbi:MAG: hypothetical protein RMJ56_02540 [Gemmataceae bacterium]|nr:hypothetical protein [Gemmata sp.]MDW8196465.1 hypothetical protein [Gemmataceae bacterium]
MKTAGLILLLLAALDLLMLALLLGTVWIAHRAVRQKAAEEGEFVPSASQDFRLLFGLLVTGLIILGLLSLLLLST